jgi:mycothiol synthase
MIIRPVEEAGRVDLSPLGACARQLHPSVWAEGERGWLALEAGSAWGCVLTTPVPGLPGLYDIAFYVAPQRRRQRIASMLWQEAQTALAGEPEVRRVSAAPGEQGDALGSFLAAQGFQLEHEEWEMQRDRLDDLDEPQWPAGYRAATFSRGEAIRSFISLYDASFGPAPWYQPFSESEVAETLDAAGDLLFAVSGSEPVGVAWMRLEEALGVIEPVGVTPAHQGKGVGRALLASALLRLRRRGATAARLGVWQDNEVAIRLYQQMGFRQSRSRIYLGYDLDESPARRRLR